MKQNKGNVKPGSAPEVNKPKRQNLDDLEPSSSKGPIPVWLFVALAALLFWGMMFLDKNAGGFNSAVYAPFASSNLLAVYNAPADDPIARGVKVYNSTCISCHQASGLGVPTQFPPLAGSEWPLAPEPDRIIRIVLDGFTGPVKVKDQDFAGTMLPWRGNFNDQQIADVLTFVRKSWGNNAPVVKADQVKKIRDATAAHAGSNWTAAELSKIPDGR